MVIHHPNKDFLYRQSCNINGGISGFLPFPRSEVSIQTASEKVQIFFNDSIFTDYILGHPQDKIFKKAASNINRKTQAANHFLLFLSIVSDNLFSFSLYILSYLSVMCGQLMIIKFHLTDILNQIAGSNIIFFFFFSFLTQLFDSCFCH